MSVDLAAADVSGRLKRCTGHCCRAFWLSLKPGELLEAFDAAMLGERPWDDPPLLARLAVPLEVPPPGTAPVAHGAYYTCRHLLENGDCGIYPSRPWTCSEYPYGHRCEVPGCTWAAAMALPMREIPTERALMRLAPAAGPGG